MNTCSWCEHGFETHLGYGTACIHSWSHAPHVMCPCPALNWAGSMLGEEDFWKEFNE